MSRPASFFYLLYFAGLPFIVLNFWYSALAFLKIFFAAGAYSFFLAGALGFVLEAQAKKKEFANCDKPECASCASCKGRYKGKDESFDQHGDNFDRID